LCADYFEADLKRRISEEGTKQKSFWEKFILPSRLIPSAGLAAAAISFSLSLIIIEEMDNPFLSDKIKRRCYRNFKC
jgi:hypothetical protein